MRPNALRALLEAEDLLVIQTDVPPVSAAVGSR